MYINHNNKLFYLRMLIFAADIYIILLQKAKYFPFCRFFTYEMKDVWPVMGQQKQFNLVLTLPVQLIFLLFCNKNRKFYGFSL